MSTAEVLRRRGIDLTDEQFAALLDEAMGSMAMGGADQPARTLTAADARVLTGGGADLGPRRPDEAAPGTEAAVTYGALLATGLTVGQAATRLGIDASRVRHRLAERSLYGVRLRAGWRLPAFQFGAGGAVPGIDRVLAALPPDLHPLAVWRWITTAQADLAGDDGPQSPLGWLLAGGPPLEAAALAADL
jgi:hypothetical protein